MANKNKIIVIKIGSNAQAIREALKGATTEEQVRNIEKTQTNKGNDYAFDFGDFSKQKNKFQFNKGGGLEILAIKEF